MIHQNDRESVLNLPMGVKVASNDVKYTISIDLCEIFEVRFGISSEITLSSAFKESCVKINPRN